MLIEINVVSLQYETRELVNTRFQIPNIKHIRKMENLSEYIKRNSVPGEVCTDLTTGTGLSGMGKIRKDLTPDQLGKLHKAKKAIRVLDQRKAVENIAMAFQARDERRDRQRSERREKRKQYAY